MTNEWPLCVEKLQIFTIWSGIKYFQNAHFHSHIVAVFHMLWRCSVLGTIILFECLEKVNPEFHIVPTWQANEEKLCEIVLTWFNFVWKFIRQICVCWLQYDSNKMEFKSVAMILQQPVFKMSRHLILLFYHFSLAYIAPVCATTPVRHIQVLFCIDAWARCFFPPFCIALKVFSWHWTLRLIPCPLHDFWNSWIYFYVFTTSTVSWLIKYIFGDNIFSKHIITLIECNAVYSVSFSGELVASFNCNCMVTSSFFYYYYSLLLSIHDTNEISLRIRIERI